MDERWATKPDRHQPMVIEEVGLENTSNYYHCPLEETGRGYLIKNSSTYTNISNRYRLGQTVHPYLILSGAITSFLELKQEIYQPQEQLSSGLTSTKQGK